MISWMVKTKLLYVFLLMWYWMKRKWYISGAILDRKTGAILDSLGVGLGAELSRRTSCLRRFNVKTFVLEAIVLWFNLLVIFDYGSVAYSKPKNAKSLIFLHKVGPNGLDVVCLTPPPFVLPLEKRQKEVKKQDILVFCNFLI